MDAASALHQLAAIEARESFYAFRQHISTKQGKGVTLKLGWFVKELCHELQSFYDDLIAGKKPTLVVEAPPQHGKSVAVIEFIAWLWGKHPELRTIYTSFSDRLGVRANLRLRRIFNSKKYQQVFPEFRLNGAANTTLLESGVDDGAFRNTTVMGSITGETLDLGVVDDPMKGREQANSEVFRDKTWDWFTDDFFTRFDENAGLLIILTRWHIDDPVGRLLEIDESVRRLQYRAIATEDEKHRKEGEPLFPAHKSLEFLNKRKKVLGSANFESLYQQNPTLPDGGMIKLSWFQRYDHPPAQPDKIVTSWDTAVKAKQINDPSVGMVWAVYQNNYYLLDVVRVRQEYPELRKTIINLADKWANHAILIEDKASGQSLLQDFKRNTRLPVIPIMPTMDKETRMSAETATIESGRVFLPNRAPWLSDLEAEMLSFPNSKHDDQCDALSQFLKWIRERGSRPVQLVRRFD